MAECNTVVCKTYIKNVGEALRTLKEDQGLTYALSVLPAAIQEVSLPTQTVEGEASVWIYEGKEYALVEKEQVKYAVTVEEGALKEIKYPERLEVTTQPYRRRYVLKKGEESTVLDATGLTAHLVYGDGSKEAYTPAIDQTLKRTDAGMVELWFYKEVLGRKFWAMFCVELCDENENVELDGAYLYQIADAIRKRNGRKRLYRASEFAQALLDLRYAKYPNPSEVLPTDDPSYLEVTHLPDRVYYVIKSLELSAAIDYTGLVISLVQKESRTEVTEECTILPRDGDLLYRTDQGILECQVEYLGETKIYHTSFEISVRAEGEETVPVRPLYIYVAALPDNVSYEIPEGALFVSTDHTGVRIEAVYEDGSHVDVTDACAIAGGDLYRREGTGFFHQACPVWWFEKESCQEFTTSFQVYVYDLNEAEHVVSETIAWKDPDGYTSYTWSSSDGYTYTTGTKEKRIKKLVFYKEPADIPLHFSPPEVTLMENGVQVKKYAVRIFHLLRNAEVLLIYEDNTSKSVTPQYLLGNGYELSSYLTKKDIEELPEGVITPVTAKVVRNQIRLYDKSSIRLVAWEEYVKRYPYRVHIRTTVQAEYNEKGIADGFGDYREVRFWWFASLKPITETIDRVEGAYEDYRLELSEEEDASLNRNSRAISTSLACQEWQRFGDGAGSGGSCSGIGSPNSPVSGMVFTKSTSTIVYNETGEVIGSETDDFAVLYNNLPDSPYYKVT